MGHQEQGVGMSRAQQRSLILISSGGRLGLIEPGGNGER